MTFLASLLAVLSMAGAHHPLAGEVVGIDPGHNGSNDGSIGRQVPTGRGGTKDCQTSGTATNAGYMEHTFTWDTALRLRAALNALGVRTALGEFGAEMEVELVNDGPFTIWLDTDDR